MRQELLMPKLGLTMTEGTLVEWSVALGAEFRAGDNLMVIESDKVTVEVPAEHDGVLLETTVKVGDVVNVGSVVGYVAKPGTAAAVAGAPVQAPATVSAPLPESSPQRPAVSSSSSGTPDVPPVPSERIIATPLAHRVARNLSVDLRAVSGTGPRGRIRADDVKAAAGRQPPPVNPKPGPMDVPLSSGDPRTPAQATGPLTKPSNIQATMARRLTMAKQQIPHFYLAAEAEVSQLLAARAQINASGLAVKLTLNHLMVAAVARALRDLPDANQVWTDDGIQAFESIDVGVAVSAERGLLVPVVRDIARASMAEIAVRTNEVVDRARQGALRPTDMGGTAITISNAGMHEVTWMTPIINPGTAMILGVGSIREVFRPDAEGRPILRREMGLVLAADHRLVDGVAGLAFLNRVIAHLRNPLPMLCG